MKTIDKKYEELVKKLGELDADNEGCRGLDEVVRELSLTLIDAIGAVPAPIAPFVAFALENIAATIVPGKMDQRIKKNLHSAYGNSFGMVRVPNSVLERLKNEKGSENESEN